MCEEDITDVEGVLSGKNKEDETPIVPTVLDREVPTPKVNDNYVNASVMLPRGNIYARGKFIGQKIDADGNSIGRRNDNTILDTRKYRFEFDDGEVRKLTANVIADSM